MDTYFPIRSVHFASWLPSVCPASIFLHCSMDFLFADSSFFHNFNIPFDECQHQNLFFKDICVQMGESVISCPRSVSPFPICFSSFLVLDGKRCRNTRISPKPVQEKAKKGDERSIGEDRSSPFPADPCIPRSGPILDPRQALFAGFLLGTCVHFYRLAFLCWRDMV